MIHYESSTFALKLENDSVKININIFIDVNTEEIICSEGESHQMTVVCMISNS